MNNDELMKILDEAIQNRKDVNNRLEKIANASGLQDERIKQVKHLADNYMTKREQLAASVIGGLVSNPNNGHSHGDLVKIAFAIADEMLKQGAAAKS